MWGAAMGPRLWRRRKVGQGPQPWRWTCTRASSYRSTSSRNVEAHAEDGDDLEARLAVDPLRPETAVGLLAAEPDVGDGRQAGLTEPAV
jgi:hypothetical protein